MSRLPLAPLRRAAVLGLAALLSACAAPRQNETVAQAEGGLQVVSTCLPITLFTRAVAGEGGSSRVCSGFQGRKVLAFFMPHSPVQIHCRHWDL
ncbi:MAG: hypothetical protein ACKOPS_04715, partial [Cyanobium sp.]